LSLSFSNLLFKSERLKVQRQKAQRLVYFLVPPAPPVLMFQRLQPDSGRTVFDELAFASLSRNRPHHPFFLFSRTSFSIESERFSKFIQKSP